MTAARLQDCCSIAVLRWWPVSVLQRVLGVRRLGDGSRTKERWRAGASIGDAAMCRADHVASHGVSVTLLLPSRFLGR